jgi:hypothetical protein
MRRAWPLSVLLGASMLLIPSQPGLGDGTSRDKQSKRYTELISQLVSPNKEPTTGDESVSFPKGYDVRAQRRVEAARRVLHENFEDAFPYLVDALDDGRYCMTISWGEGDAYYNYSVGKIYRDMIASQFEVYRDKIEFSGPQHWHRYDYRLISTERLRSRKGRSLSELQIEAIDWAIEPRKTAPEKERRKEELAALRDMRDQIAKSGRPAKPKRMLPMVLTDK